MTTEKPSRRDEIRPEGPCAVITGDVVGSSKLSADQRRQLLDEMTAAGAELREMLGPAMPVDADIFGGDSWQVLVTRPELALRATLLYRARLLAGPVEVDTRAVLAIGPVDFVPATRVSQGEGPAFQLSGRTLSEMPARRHLAFRTTAPPADQTGWTGAFRLLDALIRRRWTPARARAIAGALRGWTQSRTATQWNPPIQQASVSRILTQADWEAVEDFLQDYEQTDWTDKCPL